MIYSLQQSYQDLLSNLGYIKSIDVIDVSPCVICFVVSLILSSNLYLFIRDGQYQNIAFEFKNYFN